jgi:hypothetical protein
MRNMLYQFLFMQFDDKKVSQKKTQTTSQPDQPKSADAPGMYLQDNRPARPAHKQITADPVPPPETIQKKANTTGLPDQLKTGIENISGYSMDDVKVHYNSGEPAQLQAHAFAQGRNIHLAPGQEQHLPHEAWHVVQQKQGRVQATMQLKGNLPVNDDAGLEAEADCMGAKAASLVPAGTAATQPGSAGSHGNVVQREKKFGFELQASNGWIGEQNTSTQKYDLVAGKDLVIAGKLVDITSDFKDIELITKAIPTDDEKAKEAVREEVVSTDKYITSGTDKAAKILSEDAIEHIGRPKVESAIFTQLKGRYFSVTPADKILNYKVQFTFGAGLSEVNGTLRTFLSDKAIWREGADGEKDFERKIHLTALEHVPEPNTPIGGLTSILLATATAIMFNKAGSTPKDIVHFMQRTPVKNMYDELKIPHKKELLDKSLEISFAKLGFIWDKTPLVDTNKYMKEITKRQFVFAKMRVAALATRDLNKNPGADKDDLKAKYKDRAEKDIPKNIDGAFRKGLGKAHYVELTLKSMTDRLLNDAVDDLDYLFSLWDKEIYDKESAELQKTMGEPGTIMEARRIKETATIGQANEWMGVVGSKFKGKAPAAKAVAKSQITDGEEKKPDP